MGFDSFMDCFCKSFAEKVRSQSLRHLKAPLCKGGSARRAVGDCTGRLLRTANGRPYTRPTRALCMRTVKDAGPYGCCVYVLCQRGCPSGGAKPQEWSVVGFRGGNSQHPSVDLCILSLDGESMAGVWGGSAHPGTNQYHKDGIRRERAPADGQWPSLHLSDIGMGPCL